MIGNFLKSGGYGTSAQGHCTLDSPPIINNEWSAKINGTLGPLYECGGENGETMCIPQMCTVCASSLRAAVAELATDLCTLVARMRWTSA